MPWRPIRWYGWNQTLELAEQLGSRSDRVEVREAPEIRQMGQAPGVLPSFILDHLLPVAVVMHKQDLDHELPPCIV